MSIISHVSTGVGLSALTGQPYYLGIAFSLLPDLDHLAFIHTWQFKEGGFFHARSFMHELLGLSLVFAVGIVLSYWYADIAAFLLLCVSMHFFLDFINGKSIPYRVLRKDAEIIDFGKVFKHRVFQEIFVNIIFIGVAINEYAYRFYQF